MWMKLPDGGLLNLDQAFTLDVSTSPGGGYQVRAIAPHSHNPAILLGEFDSHPDAVAYLDSLALVSCCLDGYFRGEAGFGYDPSSAAAHELKARALKAEKARAAENEKNRE